MCFETDEVRIKATGIQQVVFGYHGDEFPTHWKLNSEPALTVKFLTLIKRAEQQTINQTRSPTAQSQMRVITAETSKNHSPHARFSLRARTVKESLHTLSQAAAESLTSLTLRLLC